MARNGFAAGALLGAAVMAGAGAYAALGGTDGVMIPYKGRLDSGGMPVNGSHTFRFTVFNVPTGGTACGTVPDVTTQVNAGEFQVMVGPVLEQCVVGEAVWLAVAVRPPEGSNFVALQQRQRVYPTLAALTSGRGDFAARGYAMLMGTNPGVSLRNGSNTEQGNLGLATSLDAYSTDAVAGDVVVRSNAGSVLMQSGSGATAVQVDSTNTTYIRRGLQLSCTACGSQTTLNGNSNYGNMTLQGRVVSANSNIHLSPPGGSNVVIDDVYRAAGGTAGGNGAGLQVQGRITAGNILGNPVNTFTTGTNYTASSDGFVVGTISVVDAGFYCGTWGVIRGEAGGRVRGLASVNAHCGGTDYPNIADSFTMPVRRGESWRVDANLTGAALNPVTVDFIPLGAQ